MAEGDTKRDGTLRLGIAGAFITAFAHIVSASQQAYSALALEGKRAESDRVSASIKRQNELVDKALAGDRETTLRNLKFYVSVGLLDDPGHKIATGLSADDVPVRRPGGAIACYSHNATGSRYQLPSAGDAAPIYVMGIIGGLEGSYAGRVFLPAGFEDADLSRTPKFKERCNHSFPACEGTCWAGGDTGGLVPNG